MQITPFNIKNTDQNVVRIDHNFTSNHKIFGRLYTDKSKRRKPAAYSPEFRFRALRRPTQMFQAKFSLYPTPEFSRIHWSMKLRTIIRQSDSFNLIGRGTRADYWAQAQLPKFFLKITPMRFRPSVPFQALLLSVHCKDTASNTQSTFSDNVTYTRGNHIFKFGSEINPRISKTKTPAA